MTRPAHTCRSTVDPSFAPRPVKPPFEKTCLQPLRKCGKFHSGVNGKAACPILPLAANRYLWSIRGNQNSADQYKSGTQPFVDKSRSKRAMIIESINLRNIYSFCDQGTAELADFKQFNLFIGKNGSGKTTVFRVLRDLDLKICTAPLSVSLSQNIFNKSIHKSAGGSNSREEKKTGRDLSINFKRRNIEFKDSRHVAGDYFDLKRSVEHIGPGVSFDDLKQTLQLLRPHLDREICLSFALDFIFGIAIRIKSGGIGEWVNGGLGGMGGRHVHRGQSPDELNACEWSSGYISVTEILSRLLLTKKPVVCLDEPETNLEPRICRNLIRIMFWLSSPLDDSLEPEITKRFKSWVDEHQESFQLDSSKAKSYIRMLHNNCFKEKQIFISTHSPVFIDEFIRHESSCSIYEFDTQKEKNEWVRSNRNYENREVVGNPIISTVRKIDAKYSHGILDNLGARGSDILQSNGIVWVEGPSDVIYIKKWLQMYSAENDLPPLEQGYHYEFQMFGGALLDSLCAMKDAQAEDEQKKKLVSMFSFSRNAFLVTDSDAVKKDAGKIVDQSNFGKAKKYISGQFEALASEGYSLGIWYKENCTEIRTLEAYLDDKTIKKWGKIKKHTNKKKYAKRVVSWWGDDKKLGDLKHELADEIAALDSMIRRWNGLA